MAFLNTHAHVYVMFCCYHTVYFALFFSQDDLHIGVYYITKYIKFILKNDSSSRLHEVSVSFLFLEFVSNVALAASSLPECQQKTYTEDYGGRHNMYKFLFICIILLK